MGQSFHRLIPKFKFTIINFAAIFLLLESTKLLERDGSHTSHSRIVEGAVLKNHREPTTAQ